MAPQPSANSTAVDPPRQLIGRQRPLLGAGGGRWDRGWRSASRGRRRRCGPPRAQSSGHAHSSGSDPLIKRFPSEEGLPLSLYTPYEGLPLDGETQTERELTCDPMHQNCQTPSYVYEDECSLCKGTGQMESKYKGRHRLYSCTLCSGLGYVRRTTTRFIPDVNNSGPKMTLARPKQQEDLPPHLRNGRLRSGFKKKD